MRLSRQRSGTAIRPPPSIAVTSRNERPTSVVLAARLEVGGMRPERGEDGVRRLQRVDAQFGHAEIGGAAGHLDVGDEEAHLRRIDVERGRLDIDGEVGPRHFAGRR